MSVCEALGTHFVFYAKFYSCVRVKSVVIIDVQQSFLVLLIRRVINTVNVWDVTCICVPHCMP